MKLSKSRIFFLLLVVALSIVCTIPWQNTDLDRWVNTKLTFYSKKFLPVGLSVSHVEVRILPPTLSLYSTVVTPQEQKIKSLLEPFEIGRVTIQPSIPHLLIGRLHLAKVELDNSRIKARYTVTESSEDMKIELEKILHQIPVTQVQISNVQANVSIKNKNQVFFVSISPLSATITNDLNNLLVKLRAEKMKFLIDDETVLKNTFFETHFFLTEKNFVLSDFKIKEQDSFLVASGSTQHILSNKSIKSGKLNIRAYMKAHHGKDLARLVAPQADLTQLQPLDGAVKTDLRFDIKSIQDFNLETRTYVYKLEYDNFKIGDIAISGSYQHAQQQLSVAKLKVENSGFEGELGPTKLSLKDFSLAETEVLIKSFSLNPFLKYAINKDIPAHVEGHGKTLCSGSLQPLRIDCRGEIEGKNILVNPNAQKPLLSMPAALKGVGSFTVTAKELTYKASIDAGHSKGESDGEINYKTGFAINYSTPQLDFTAIQKLAGLDIGGKAKIQGFTRGNSRSAIFELSLDGKEMKLEKYFLGDISHQLKYNDGVLLVPKIQGAAASSRYLGNLQIQLDKNRINGKIQFPFVDLSVMQSSIKENLSLPVQLTGSGAAIVTIDSLLDPEKLSFKAKARLYNCTIDQQHIEMADIDLSSEMGKISIANAVFEEKNSQAQLTGVIHLDRKEFELGFQSPKIYLDDIIYATKYSTPTRGLFSLKGNIRGPFRAPNVDVDFVSENFQLAGKKIAPIKGHSEIFSTKTIAQITGPNNFKFIFRNVHNLPDYQIEGTTDQFDIAPLVTSLLGIEHTDDFKIDVTSNFNIKIPRVHPENMSGYLHIPALTVDTERNKLASSKEISLFFTQGKINFSPFEMAGSGGNIKFKSNATNIPLDIHISGLFSLSFVHLLTPFLETIEGQTTINVRLQRSVERLEFFGSAFIDNGYLKIPDVQHAVENLKVDLLFNQDRINLNSLKAKFASGQLLGDGSIRLIGPKNVPLDLNLHIDNMDLNIPPQVNTVGSADLKLSGQWLPFELSGTYHVIDGLITKEFTSGDANSKNPHEIFLPQALRNEDQSPVVLKLEIIPSVPLNIKNSLIDGKIQGQISVSGTPNAPILGGQIQFTKFSQILFRDIVFRVRDSNIVLSNTNPPNPDLYILADARYKGYDIEMLVQGTADKPKFTLTSQPSLTQPEIISLLALGYTTNEAALSNANAAGGISNTTNNESIDSQGMQVGTSVFGQNPLGKEFKNRFGVDVQFSSRFDSNSSVAVPTIGFSKKISERTSFVGSVQTGKVERTEGKLRYELDRGFAGTMSVQSVGQDNNLINGNTLTDILGIDLEFRKEFK
jgi:translocation and assembly module TamB